jgi:hypothetical protein
MAHYLKLLICFIFIHQISYSQTTEINLFDGKSLDGWVIENNGQFSVENGVLKLNKGTGWLRSEETYKNFKLYIKFRFLEKEANSGIFVRTASSSTALETGWPDNGYQVQCKDIITGEAPLGVMIPYGAPPFTHQTDLDALAKAYKPIKEWNEFEITCVNEDLTVVLNGVKITEASNIVLPSGHIGIQGELGSLEFKKINVTILP